MTVDTLLSTITRSKDKAGHSTKLLEPTISYAAGPSTRNVDHSYAYGQPQRTGLSMEGSMDVDDNEFISPSASHPLSVLHRQLIEHLSDLLRPLAYDAALVEQAKRGTNDAAAPAPKKSGLYTSIHAPKVAEPVVITQRFIMPKYEDVLAWSCLDCIHFTLEFPPHGEDDGETRKNRQRPSIGKLNLFLRPHDMLGGRRGKDWSIGDWQQALEELEQVAIYCSWTNVHEVVEICRNQLTGLFSS